MQTPADIIEQWFREQFHNSAASRNTEIYNQLTAAKDDLKTRFSGPKADAVVADESTHEKE